VKLLIFSFMFNARKDNMDGLIEELEDLDTVYTCLCNELMLQVRNATLVTLVLLDEIDSNFQVTFFVDSSKLFRMTSSADVSLFNKYNANH
jgi:hypothetical protein